MRDGGGGKVETRVRIEAGQDPVTLGRVVKSRLKGNSVDSHRARSRP